MLYLLTNVREKVEVHDSNVPVHKKAKIRGTKRPKIVNTDECSKNTCISQNTTANKKASQ